MEQSNQAIFSPLNQVLTSTEINNEAQIYRDSIYRLERELTDDIKSVESLKEWINCYIELGHIYQNSGDIENARKCLIIPHQSMLYMRDSDHSDDDVKLIAQHAMSLTLPALLDFARIFPFCPDCMQDLNRQYAALQHSKRLRLH